MVSRIGSDHPPTVPSRPRKGSSKPAGRLGDVKLPEKLPIQKRTNKSRLQASRSTRNRVVIVGETPAFRNAALQVPGFEGHKGYKNTSINHVSLGLVNLA